MKNETYTSLFADLLDRRDAQASTPNVTVEVEAHPVDLTVTVAVEASSRRVAHGLFDTNCICCGRQINYRSAVAVRVVSAPCTRYDGATDSYVNDGGEAVFAPIAKFLGTEPAEWASAVGSTCAEKLPRTHRTPMERATGLVCDTY